MRMRLTRNGSIGGSRWPIDVDHPATWAEVFPRTCGDGFCLGLERTAVWSGAQAKLAPFAWWRICEQ
jgi:hypothetical protein